MRLNNLKFKIMLPLIMLPVVFIVFLAYLLINLKLTSDYIKKNNESIRTLSSYSSQITSLRRELDEYVLYYRFTKDAKYLHTVYDNQRRAGVIIGKMTPLVNDLRGRELLDNFLVTRNGMIRARDEFISAVGNNSPDEISKFIAWEAKSEINYAALSDFNTYTLNKHALDEMEYQQLVEKMLFTLGFITFFTLLMLYGLYLYLSRIITSPIKKLSYAAERISEGNFNTRLNIRSKDEMGALARSLENMAFKLKDYYKRLNQEVRKRDLEIKRRKEFEAQKDDFMNMASHEFNTPVTSLKLYEQILRKELKKDRLHKYDNYLKKIDDQIRKLSSLTSGFLDVTRIQVGKMPIDKRPFDLNKCISDVLESSRKMSKQHLKFIPNGDLKVIGDEERISQVISNLVSNAVKYSPENTEIIVDTTIRGNNALISVKDNGMGMEKRHLKKIFERFYRVDATNSRTFSGMGIGLFMCSEIIKKHNGRIWAESKLKKGSTFYFTLPLAK